MKVQADNLSGLEGIGHGFYSSRGGVSTGIYESLNTGLGSKDDPQHVMQNRALIAADLGVDATQLVSPHQVHSPIALIVEGPWQEGVERPKVDALVTNTPGLAIGILTADCAPVLFCDSEARVIGAAHAGWRGAVGGVLDHTIEQMCVLGARKERIMATVGPAISQRIYEVGDEFRDNLASKDPAYDQFFALPLGAAKVHFDLQGFARHRLQEAGLCQTGIVQHCTFGREEQYFSYRRSQKNGHTDYGRQISAIVIG